MHKPAHAAQLNRNMYKMTITDIIVIYYHEEGRMEACLKSFNFSSQLIDVDIGSKDRYIEIAYACLGQPQKAVSTVKMKFYPVSHVASI